MLKSEAAAYLAGVTQTEGAEASAPTNLHVITGEVGEASADGKTLVKIDGLMFSESDDQFIEVDALGGLEEGDIATIVLTGEQGHAMTPLALGSIGSVDRITVRIAAIEADYIKVEQLDAAEARIGELEADHVSVDDLDAATARIGTLETTRATITDLEAATARIHSLEVDHVTIDNFEAATARIDDLEADHVSTDDLDAATARIGTLETNTADIGTIRANSAKVQNLTAAELEADHATIEALDSNYAHITNGVIDNATIGYADVNNLSAHYAEIQNGKINSALINTAAIVDEQVFTVTGNKATISQLNADHINVRSINVKDLTVETANGYVNVGGKQTPTKELLDSIKDELQQEIDGAVETFTSSAVPLLNNYPASDWIISGATEEEQRKAYAKHIGDICYVQNSALDQNGYAYRFAYDSTEQTFKWVLIKDSDVTKALGDISDLKTFESETTTWMEETDEGLTTIRQNHTTLSGVVDKTVVETKQLWFTKSNTTAPNKPTAQVTSTSTAGNAWRVVVPAYNASYPNYYYCLQYKLADGTYAWSDVVRDIAMGESQQQGRKGVADAAAAQSAAETADGKAVTAQNTADSAVTAASTADGKAVAAQTTANANIKSSVQLWFTKANTTAPNKPAAQVTVNDASKTNQWNLAIPTYSASYPNYFYCYQQQKGDGTWQWTDVVYDRSITEAQAKAQASLPSSEFNTFKTTTFKELVDEVDEQSSTISTLSETVSTKADSSTVTTLSNTVNTVKQTADTNKTSITNLTKTVSDNKTAIETRASTIEQNLSGITTRVGKTESELDTVSNPNLTPYFSRDKGDVYNASTNPSGYWKKISADYITALDDGWVHISASNSGTSNLSVNYFTAKTSVPKDLVASTKYTFLVETRGVTKSGNVVVYASHHFGSELHAFTSSAGYSVSGDESKYFAVTSASDLSSIACFTRGYVQVPSKGSVDMDIRISLYEGEYSGPYKPYIDQTLSNRVKSAETSIEQNADAIALRATKAEVYQSAQPNLSPYFQSTPITTAGGYWIYFANTNASFTPTGDGWCRIVLDNRSGTSVKRCDFDMDACPSVEPGKDYTLLYEIRNIACSGSIARTYVVQAGNELNRGIQFWGNSAHTLLQGYGTNCTVEYINTASGSGNDRAELCDDGIYRKRVVRKSETSDSTYYTRATDKELMRLVAYANAGAYIDVELRVSLYPGVYTGPYKPYSGDQLYATQSELKVQADRIGMVVSNTDASSSLALTADAMEYIGDHVEIKGTDGTSTVISGGKVQANSIGAYELNATDINASKTLTVGAMTDAAASSILNSNVVVGGRNLLLRTATLSDTTYWWRNSITSVIENETDERGGSDAVLVTPSTTSWYLASTNDNTRIDDIGGQYVASVWMRANTETTVQLCCRYLKNDTDPYSNNATRKIVTVTTEWQQFTVAGRMIGNQTGNENCVWVGQLTSVPVYVSHFKLERGNKTTDWTPAPEDMAASVDQTYVQNLTPYFLTDMTKTSDEYWANLTYERFSRLGDGWAHFEYANSSSSTVNNFIKPKLLDFLEPGGKYTLLIEFKNVSISKDGGYFYSQQGNDVQVWGDKSDCGFAITNAEIRALSGGAGTFYKTLTLLTADSKDPSGTVRGSLPKTSFMSINQQVVAGQTISYDLRLSLYADGYTGPYKPYSGTQLYASGADVNELNASLIATEESLSGQIRDTNDGLGAVSTAVKKLDETVQQDRADIGRWLNFNESDGLTIGKAGSQFKVVTDETRQAFMYGNETLAYTSGDRFVAPRMEADELHIGNWMWVKRDNGNLSLKWIG